VWLHHKIEKRRKEKHMRHLYMCNFIIYNQYNQLQKRKEKKILKNWKKKQHEKFS